MILLYKGVLSSETLDTTNHPLYNELIFRSSLIILNEEGFLTKEAIYKSAHTDLWSFTWISYEQKALDQCFIG